MRIISGKYKNKKLYFPKNFTTRPLKDSVRENIFNILEHSKNINFQIKDSYVADLYAGTGSFGLECLSRNASLALFVEKDKEALTNLKKNILNLSVINQAKIYSDDVLKFFKNSTFKKKIDLCFLDPPYKNEDYIDTIEILKKKSVLNKNHILVLHREKGFKDRPLENLNIIENRVYGRSQIFFLRLF